MSAGAQARDGASDVWTRLGVPPILNAAGTLTRLSGAPMRPEVIAAMAEAAARPVEMAVLQAAASRRIAAATGAEAGIVTPGAAAALALAAASAIAGLSTRRMDRLADRTIDRREIVVPRSHRNGYDVALRLAGARLVEVGLADRVAGAGVRDVDLHEIADAIGEETAAIHVVARHDLDPPLRDIASLARRAGVPLIVDAAAQLPPVSNLTRFIGEGADLVAFSGGKAIGGPAGSGILCGRADLVMSAALQHLDLDVFAATWDPPAGLIDKARLAGPPRHGIGRIAKIGREQVAGLLVALEHFLTESDAARHARWLAIVDALATRLDGDPRPGAAGARIERRGARDTGCVPTLALHLDAGAAAALVAALQAARPAVHVDARDHRRGIVVVNPLCLCASDAVAVAEALLGALAADG